jgi:hypothetical protein
VVGPDGKPTDPNAPIPNPGRESVNLANDTEQEKEAKLPTPELPVDLLKRKLQQSE